MVLLNQRWEGFEKERYLIDEEKTHAKGIYFLTKFAKENCKPSTITPMRITDKQKREKNQISK